MSIKSLLHARWLGFSRRMPPFENLVGLGCAEWTQRQASVDPISNFTRHDGRRFAYQGALPAVIAHLIFRL
jgi:hypothetical protein